MSDLLTMTELMAVASDDASIPPEMPPTDERRAIRRAANISPEEMAVAIGVSVPTLTRAERGGQMRMDSERRYRKALAFARQRVAERDPVALTA